MPRPIEQESSPGLRPRESPNRLTRNLALRIRRARGSAEAVVFERTRRLVQFYYLRPTLVGETLMVNGTVVTRP
jgi:hypothetical protein